MYGSGSEGQLAHWYRLPMIHSLQFAQRALWSRSSRTVRTVERVAVECVDADTDGVPRPPAGTVPVGAYTVSASTVGELDREDCECAAATVDESCWNHLSRARRDTASTSAVASGIGIWRERGKSQLVTHLHHDMVRSVLPVSSGTKPLALDTKVPGGTHRAVEARADNIL